MFGDFVEKNSINKRLPLRSRHLSPELARELCWPVTPNLGTLSTLFLIYFKQSLIIRRTVCFILSTSGTAVQKHLIYVDSFHIGKPFLDG